MIAVIDYGLGNLFSLTASLSHLHMESQITRDPAVIRAADGIILPGVGAFGDAIRKLEELRLKDVLIQEAQSAKPFLGICLGMQLLFEKSYEYGEHQGLSLLPGCICPLREDLKNPEALVPHMGWNQLRKVKEDPIVSSMEDGTYAYFVHSFYAKDCQDVLIADAEYEGVLVPAIVGQGHVYGMQFHPEKSGSQGLRLLKAFGDLCGVLQKDGQISSGKGGC